jgi:putative nucleotidyltransferase with HDIG domain
LTAAFEALEVFPALAESRDRVLRLIREQHRSTGDVVAAVESDVALVATVMRLANRVPGKRHGKIASVPAAVELLTPAGIEELATRARVFDFFERTPGWDVVPERFRLHAVAAQAAADRLANMLDYGRRDELLTSALLHDVGKLVLMHAYPGYPGDIHGTARTPEQRIHRERRELGIDHALVGGVLARRWGLPGTLASAIERHHADDAVGEAALVRLADMLTHYHADGAVDRHELLRAAAAVDLPEAGLRELMYDLPYTTSARQLDPSPLSSREREVLKRLATGMVYKEIAEDLDLSTSTIRTHLHNTYAKLGASDRAQAVLIASSRGWL